MNTDFDINLVLDELRKRSKIFRNEDDLKQKLRDVILDLYNNARVETEYRSPFDVRKSIDIVLIRDNEYYPIELKYKKLAFKGIVDNIEYNLSTDNAQNENCYSALKDVERIEKFRDNEPLFKKGYTIFLTNDLSYLNVPRENAEYKEFSIHENVVKTGTLNWNRVDKAEYYNHIGNENILNDNQKENLIKFLSSKPKYDNFNTNWELLIFSWEHQNNSQTSMNEILTIPNYTKLTSKSESGN